MPKVAVVLSGCGVFDGAEIHESVLTLLELDLQGAVAVCFAPDVGQYHVVDHLTGSPAEGVSRNVLTESARIARGRIQPVTAASAADFDAAVFPGGFGAAKNLCTFAVDGIDCEVETATANFIRQMSASGKVLGFSCISPALCAKVLGHLKPTLTIGTDAGTAEALTKLGAVHESRSVTEVCVDSKNRIVTTPAYMCDASISEVAKGISNWIAAVLKMVAG